MGENLGILSLASDININHTIWKLLFNTVSSTVFKYNSAVYRSQWLWST